MPTRRQSHRYPLIAALVGFAAVLPPPEAASQEPSPRPPQALVDERLDSLEQDALNDTTTAGRLRAVAAIANVGQGSEDCANTSPSVVAQDGVVPRLASIYRRSRDAEVRHSILGRMVSQAECDEAVAFLTEVAEEVPSSPRTNAVGLRRSPATPQSDAVFLLLEFGARGDSALRRLHSAGSVRDSFALASLDNLSRTGFRRLVQAPKRAPLPIDAYDHLDSLEHAALTGPTFAARLAAVSSITRIGLYEGNCGFGSMPSNVKYTGLVSRLSSIYWRSTDASLRDAILRKMLWHAECAEAVEFLAGAAEEPPPPPKPQIGIVIDGFRNTLQSDAVSMLLSFGDLGELALRRLQSEGSVRDSFARELLEKLAGNDFKRPK